MQIDFDNYSIAPIHQKDAWRLCDFVTSNADRFKAYFPGTLKANLTPTLSELFVAQKTKEFQNKEEFLFTVKENTNRTIIGLVYLKELQQVDNQGELAYCIGYQYEGKGLTTKIVATIIDWAFADLKLKTLQIVVHKSNIGSARIAEKTGFHFQKTLPKHHTMYNGEVVDMELYVRYNSLI